MGLMTCKRLLRTQFCVTVQAPLRPFSCLETIAPVHHKGVTQRASCWKPFCLSTAPEQERMDGNFSQMFPVLEVSLNVCPLSSLLTVDNMHSPPKKTQTRSQSTSWTWFLVQRNFWWLHFYDSEVWSHVRGKLFFFFFFLRFFLFLF